MEPIIQALLIALAICAIIALLYKVIKAVGVAIASLVFVQTFVAHPKESLIAVAIAIAVIVISNYAFDLGLF